MQQACTRRGPGVVPSLLFFRRARGDGGGGREGWGVVGVGVGVLEVLGFFWGLLGYDLKGCFRSCCLDGGSKVLLERIIYPWRCCSRVFAKLSPCRSSCSGCRINRFPRLTRCVQDLRKGQDLNSLAPGVGALGAAL